MNQKKYIKVFETIYKNEEKKKKKIIKFGDIETQKQKCRQHKRFISIKNKDIDKIVQSNRVSFGK